MSLHVKVMVLGGRPATGEHPVGICFPLSVDAAADRSFGRCSSELRRWGFDSVGFPGLCSLPCEHGWVFRTEDFPEELARAFATLDRYAKKCRKEQS